MEFIERIFGVSPDGGSGLVEWLLVLMGFLIVAGLSWGSRSRAASAAAGSWPHR